MSSCDSSCDMEDNEEDLIEVTVVDLAKNIKDVGGVELMEDEIGDEPEVELEPEVEPEHEVENVIWQPWVVEPQQDGYCADMEDNQEGSGEEEEA